MRDGWISKPLGEVCTLQRGFDLPKTKRIEGCYPLVSSSGVIDTHSECMVRAPGVATGRSGSIGSVFYIDHDFWPLNTVLYVKDFHGNDPRFVYYLLTHFDLSRYAGGAGVPTLNRNSVHDVPVMVSTSLHEQQRIVAILDEAFAGLATATANVEKNLRNARDLFDGYLNSIFTHRTEGWVDKSLREVSTEFGRGKSKHRPRNDPVLYDGRYPFIQTGDIRNADRVIVDYSQTYNEKGLAQSKLWPKGTICITIAANIAETGILGFDACFPDSVIGMVVDPIQTNNKFVEYLLRFFKAVLQAQGKGSAQDNINLATFENRKFPFPPVNVQNQLVERLDAMADQTRRLEASYEARLQFISELKQSVLHKAFSGELTSPSSQAVKEAAE